MKRLLVLAACICLALSGCTAKVEETEKKQYTATFLTLFDTVTTVVGRAESQEKFSETAQQVHDQLLIYHQLFDIYNDYDGVNSIKTINDMAGIAPVEVDRAIIDMLLDCRSYCEMTGGRVNVAMGSVLKLWHDARSSGINDPAHAELPDAEKLMQAAQHTDFSSVIIDEAASTVYISDPEMRLDVGAIAKGWATQRVAEESPEGLLISVGGNVCATGPKTDAGDPWVIGVRDPNGEADDYVHTLFIKDGSVVTSGDYQRAYMVDGKMYHHIIDPDTLYPSEYWRSVTVVCADSGAADALSTALFTLSYEDGLKLLEQFGAMAMWVGYDGCIYYSPGFEELIRT